MSIKNPLWYNEKVKINGKCIFYRHWFEKGIYYISDLYQPNGQIMSYEEFCTQYSIAVPFTTFYGLSNCIWKLNLPFDSDDLMYNSPFYPIFLKIICKSKKGSKDMYNEFIVKKWNKPKSEKKWELIFNLHVDQNWWKKCNQIVFHLTKDIQLRWFQYRILHRILATNSHLFKMKITNTELCSFCNTNVETLTHLFWECIYVEEL